MLPDIGGTELLVIAAVALIVVGPKDLPVLLRKLGQFVGKIRGMAAEFRSSFDEMARQSELDDLRKEVEAMRQASQNALPQNLGIESALNSDAESAYMSNWAASHGPSTDSYVASAETETILPPSETPAKAPKAAKSAKSKSSAAAEGTTPKRSAAKAAAPKPPKPAKAGAPPAPRAKKAKPGAEA